MMEELVKEIRLDIKEMLQRQAIMEEKMANHAKDMAEFKSSSETIVKSVEIDTENKLKSIRSKLDPIYKWHIGAKWALGAIITVGSLIAMYGKLF